MEKKVGGLEYHIRNINKNSTAIPNFNIGKILNNFVYENSSNQDKTRIELFNEHNTSIGKYMIDYSSNIGYRFDKIQEDKSEKSESYSLDKFTKLIGKHYSMKVNAPIYSNKNN